MFTRFRAAHELLGLESPLLLSLWRGGGMAGNEARARRPLPYNGIEQLVAVTRQFSALILLFIHASYSRDEAAAPLAPNLKLLHATLES